MLWALRAPLAEQFGPVAPWLEPQRQQVLKQKKSTERLIESRLTWGDFEALARHCIRAWLQRLMEEEGAEFLGR